MRQAIICGSSWSTYRYNLFISRASGKPKLVPWRKEIDSLEPRCPVDFDTLVYQHSLFPIVALYEKWRDRKLYSAVNNYFLHSYVGKKKCDSCDIYDIERDCWAPGRFCQIEFGVSRESEKKERSKLFFCSDCMREALQKNGWAFLKRSWVVPGAQACPRHGVLMSNSQDDVCNCFSTKDKHKLESLILGYCIKCGESMWPAQSRKASVVAISIAACIEDALRAKRDYSETYYKMLENGLTKSGYLHNLYGPVRDMIHNGALALKVYDPELRRSHSMTKQELEFVGLNLHNQKLMLDIGGKKVSGHP